jgi:hypothetical protein
MHTSQAPSDWVVRWSHLLAPNSTVLDLACGWGRHVRYLASLGHRVIGVDKDAEALAGLQSDGEMIVADIENGPWPLAERQFGGIVVTHYLWRDLWPHILASLAPNGVLIYETFAVGNETVGKPSRPDFLLQHGELLMRCADLRVVAYEDGFLPHPDRFVQRIAAIRCPADNTARHLL